MRIYRAEHFASHIERGAAEYIDEALYLPIVGSCRYVPSALDIFTLVNSIYLPLTRQIRYVATGDENVARHIERGAAEYIDKTQDMLNT